MLERGPVTDLSSTRGAGSPILKGSDGTLSRYTGWKKLKTHKHAGQHSIAKHSKTHKKKGSVQ